MRQYGHIKSPLTAATYPIYDFDAKNKVEVLQQSKD